MTRKNEKSADGKGSGEVKYSIKKGTDGKNCVEVISNITNLTDRSSMLKALKKIVDTKFSNLINVYGQNIGINKKTAKEWVFSKSAKNLFNNETAKYEDKIKAFDNSDELLQAADSFIGEAKNHIRKDNFVEFARGKVQYKVGNNGYEADIIVGITKSGNANLYDIIAIKDKKITELIKYSIRDNDVPKSRHSSVNDTIISQSDTVVNGNIRKNIRLNAVTRNEFARGDVLLEIGDNACCAKVVVGFTNGNGMVVYDIIGFIPIRICKIKVGTQFAASSQIANSSSNVPTSYNVP